jgi:hemerythrin
MTGMPGHVTVSGLGKCRKREKFMSIVWSDSMSTGVAEIDEQHRELISMLNSLSDEMRSGKGKNEIEKILVFAGEYAQKHFACEERYFAEYQCPAAPQNKAAHEYFAGRFTELMQDFRAQGNSFALMMKIYNELSTWLVQHILGVDIELRASVRARKTSGTS